MQARPKGTCVCRKTPKPDQTVPHKPALAQEPDFVSHINVKKGFLLSFLRSLILSLAIGSPQSTFRDNSDKYQKVNPPKYSPSLETEKAKALESR